MKIKEKLVEYFREYWGKRVFMKSVSMLVAVCFVINIANLPAYAAKSDDELLNKRVDVTDKQEGVVNPNVARPVNEQVGINDIKAELDEGALRDLDKKEMAITQVGAIVEKSRDGKSEKIVGSIDGNGNVQIFSGDSSRPYSKQATEDYTYRAQQVLQSGAKRGQYVETHSKEYVERTGEKEGVKENKEEEKVVVDEEGIKGEKAEEAVQESKQEVVQKKQINEESVETKQNALKAMIKDKETASVTKATIAKVMESAKEAGVNLTAKFEEEGDREDAKIEVYQSRYNGENIFVGKKDGQMAYPTHNGSVEIREEKDKINIGGNEFEATGIVLVKEYAGKKEEGNVNKRTEGLFFSELIGIYDSNLSDKQVEKAKKVIEGKGEKKKSTGILNSSAKQVQGITEAVNKGVLAAHGAVTKIAAEIGKSVKREGLVVTFGNKEEKKEGVQKDKKEDGLKNSKEYKSVVKSLMKDTGASKEEVEQALDGISEEQLKVLSDFYKQEGATIVNCATDALGNVLEGSGLTKGLLALQALSIDIAKGNLSEDSVKDGQLYTSMTAVNEVLKANGIESVAYGTDLETLKDGLKEGESAIIHVDGDHYITVTKEKDGNFSVQDPNKNNGEKITYDEENFDKLMRGEEATDSEGNKQSGYNVDVNDMKVVTASEGMKEKAAEGKVRELSEAETNEITGAKYVTKTVTVAVEKTRMETRTGTRQVSSSYTDSNGVTHTETHTEEYTYEVEVSYIDYEEREEQVWVDDEPEEDASAQEQAAIEERNRAEREAEEARRAAELARLEAEVARKNLENESKAVREAEESIDRGEKETVVVSEERAEEVETANAQRVEEMERAVVEKTIEAQAATQEALTKSEEAAAIAEENFANGIGKKEGLEGIAAGVMGMSDVIMSKQFAQQEKENLEKTTQDFINLTESQELQGVEQGAINQAISFLNNVIQNGGDIINCAADALTNVTGVSNALMAMQALSIDIASGAFFNNNDVNNKNASQVQVSMDAMKGVLEQSGDYKGYLVGGVEGLEEGMKNGDVVLNVNIKDKDGKDTGHYISIITGENGDVTIRDVNKEDKVITKEEIDKAKLDGKNAVGDYLKSTYNWDGGAMLAQGTVKNGTQMSTEQMQETSGSGLLSRIKKGFSSIKKALTAKNVVSAVKKAVNSISKAEAKDTSKKSPVKTAVKTVVAAIKAVATAATQKKENSGSNKQPTNDTNNNAQATSNANKQNPVQNVWNNFKTQANNAFNNIRDRATVVVNTVSNNIAQRALERRQNQAVQAAEYGTEEQQRKANDELRRAQERATAASERLAASQERLSERFRENGNSVAAKSMNDKANDVRNATQTNIAAGEVSVAQASERRAQREYETALNGGNEQEIEKARENYVERSAEAGRVADRNIAAMEEAGNTSGAERIRNQALEGVNYGGNGESIADKKRNDATVNAAISLSNRDMEAFKKAMDNDSDNLTEVSQRAGTSADAVVEAMKATGNEDKVEEYVAKVKQDIGNKAETDPDKKISDYLADTATEITAQREVTSSQEAYETAKTDLDAANEAYREAVISGEGIEDALAARTAAEEAYLSAADKYGEALEDYDAATEATGNSEKYDAALKSAYESADVVNVSEEKPIDAIRNQSEVYVAQERVNTQEMIIDALEEKYSGTGAENYEKALEGYIEKGDEKALGEATDTRNADREVLAGYINDLDDMYENLAQKQEQAGYGEEVVSQTREKGQTAKDNYTDKVIKSDEAIQQNILDNLGETYTEKLDADLGNIDFDALQKSQEQYERELAALKAATEGLNRSYDAFLPEEKAAEAKEANSNKVTEKVVTVQDNIAKGMESLSDAAAGNISKADSTDAAIQQAQKWFEYISSAGTSLATALTNFSISLTQAGQERIQSLATDMKLASHGIVINEQDGKMTQYSSDGSKSVVDLNYEHKSSEFNYDELRDIASTEGFDRALDYTKCYGALNSLTVSDGEGEQYTARNVGYYEGDHCMALEYDFKRAGYEDGVYFKVGSDIKVGEKKIVVESFKSQENAKKEYSMVYSVKEGDDSTYNADWNNKLEIKVSGGSIDSLDRVMEWEDEIGDDGKPTGNSVAYAVDFTDGDSVTNGKDRRASGVEKIVVDPQGNVDSTRTNLSYYAEQKFGSDDNSTDGGEENFVDRYKAVLENTSRLKISGQNDLYEGYKYLDSTWINGEECTTTTTNVTNQGNKTVYNFDKDGNLVSGEVDYRKGTEVSPVLGGSLDDDTILLSNNVNFDFTVDQNGKMSMKPDTVAISGTYINRVNGKEVGRGVLQNGTISVNEQGQIGVDGKVLINGTDHFEVLKGNGDENQDQDENKDGEDKEAPAPDAKDTNAVITETDDKYEVKGGSISLRGGQLIVAGEGATALDGSVLLSAFGQVKISGDYTFKDGSWNGKDENSSYRYNDSNEAQKSANRSLKDLGIEITDDNAFEGEQKGAISSDPALMFNNLVSSRGNSGVDIEVIGDDYTIDGVSIGKGAELNISVQEVDGEKVLALRANNDGLSASYNLPEGLETNNGATSVENVQFNKGEYITAAALLNKAGVTSIKGTATWNGKETSVTINVIGGTNPNYKDYNSCSFELAGNSETVTDVNGQTIRKTNLVGEYNDGDKYTILAGAKVSLGSDGSLVVKSADVYVEGMNVSQQPKESDDEGVSAGASGASGANNNNVKVESYFEGKAEENADGDIVATGIFRNYSDATAALVFSEASIYHEDSVFTTGSHLNGLTVTEGALKISSIDEEEGIKFEGVNGTAKYKNALDEEYTVDETGKEEYVIKKEDVVTTEGQTVLYDENNNIVGVADTTVNESDKGYDDAKGFKDENGADVRVDEDDILQLGELTDVNGNGVRKFVGVKDSQIGDSKQSGWSANDDIYMIIDGKKVAVDTDGSLFSSGFDPNLKVKVTSPNINFGEEMEISISDWNNNSDSKNTKTVMYDGHVIYVDKDALNITNEQYDIDLGDGRTAEVNIDYRTETVDTHDGGSYENKKETITYTVDGKTYTYDGSATDFWGGTKTEFELTNKDDKNDYINFTLNGNDITAERVLVGSRWGFDWRGDQVSVSNFTYHASADGSGYQTVFNDFIGEYDGSKNADGTYDLRNITNSSKDSKHESTAVTTAWDEHGRRTKLDNAEYTWTGEYGDVGRGTSITYKDTSFTETYAYASDDPDATAICTSRVEYSGTLKDVKYDKSQIKEAVPVDYKETTITYNGVDENGERIEASRKTEVKTAYTADDKKQVREYLEAEGLSATEIDEILSKDSKMTFQYIDGVKYDQEVSNIKVDVYGSVGGEEEQFFRTEYINAKKQNTISTTTTDENSSKSHKTVTTTLSKQDVITAYNNTGDEKVDSVVRSKLETSQVNSTLYDDQNRVVYETQKGGVFKTTVIDGGNTERKTGAVLSHGKTDKATSYKYGDDGSVETNTVSYEYDYLDRSDKYGADAKNGIVTVSVTNTKGKYLLETTTESKTYTLNEGTTDKDGKENISTRTADYSSEPVEHTYSYSQSISLGGALYIDVEENNTITKETKERILQYVDNLDDDKLKDAVLNMTDEQLVRLVSSDNYTVFGVNVDFIEETVSIDTNVSTKTVYDAGGNVVSSIKDGGETGGTYKYHLSEKGKEQFGTGVDFSTLSDVSFTASGVFANKSTIDDTGSNLAGQGKSVNNAIVSDMKDGTNNILGDRISFSQYRQDYGYERDDLGRVTSSKFIENVNGGWIAGDTTVTYATENNSTVATSVTSYAQAKVERNADGSVTLISVDESTRETNDSQTSVYAYGNVGHNAPIDVNMKGVEQYNALGDIRDAQRMVKDEARNNVITAVVTAAYVAASVALAIVTFGGSALIQLSVTTAIAATAALAAIPSVYLGMKRGMEAVSVGDTQKAVMEFAFVALDFVMLAGAWVQSIRFTKTFVEAGNLVHSGFATAEEMAKYSAKKAAITAGKEASKAAKKLTQTTARKVLNQLLPNKVMRLDRVLTRVGQALASSGSNAFMRGVGTVLQSRALGVAASLAASAGRNYLTANAIEWAINKLGGSEFTNSSLFKSLKTIYIMSFMFDKDIANIGRADDEVAKGLKDLADLADTRFKSGEFTEKVTAKSIKEAAGEMFDAVRAGYAENGIRGGIKGYGNFVKDGFVNSFTNFWTQTLGAGQGVFSNTVANSIDNFLSVSLKHTPEMMGSIAKFQLTLNGVGGMINTQLYDAMGITLGDLVNIDLFNQLPVFSGIGDIADQMAGMTATTLTSKGMVMFSFATPLITTIVSPILNSIPGLGAVSRAMNKYGETFQSGSRSFASTFYEENIKEELLGNVFSWIRDPAIREMLQECFDGTPDGGINFNMATVNSLNVASAQMNMNTMEAITSRETTQEQKIQAARDLMAMTNAMAGSTASADGLISAIVLSGSQPLSYDDVAQYMTSRTGLSDDTIRVAAQSPVERLRNSSSQTERKDVARQIADSVGLTGEYSRNAVSRLSDSADVASANTSIEVILAAQIAAQNYYNSSGQQEALSNEQIRRVENIAESYASEFSLGELSYIVSRGVAPLVVMFDSVNTEYGGYENIDFSTMGTAEMNSFFSAMSNVQLSDFMEAMGMQLQVAPFSHLSNFKALNIATNELSKSGEFRNSVATQIETIKEDTRKANEGKSEIEINEAIIEALNDYKNTSDGVTLRERGIIETFVNRTVADISAQNLANQNASEGNAVVKQFSQDLQDALSSETVHQEELVKEYIRDFENFERIVRAVAEYDTIKAQRIRELADRISNGKKFTDADSTTVQDILVLEATVGISEVLKGQMFEAIINKVSKSNPKAAQRFEELADKVKNGETLTKAEEDEISLYEKTYSIPYAPIAAIYGFRPGQMAAFEHIVKATIVDRQQPDIKGYCEQLQTAGGKSLIGAFALELLVSLPDVDFSGKMVTWLSNEDGNADDLSKHAEFIFGETFGNVLTLNQARIDALQKDNGGLRKAFEGASVAIMTYSTWSSLFSSSMASLLSYSSDASQDIKDIVDHNRAILKTAEIELTLTKKNGETKVQFKDSTQARAAIEILLQHGLGLENTDIPLEKISMMVGDEFDYAYTIPASALASASGSYSSTSQFVDYYKYLLNATQNNEVLTIEQKEALANKYGALGISVKQITADIQMSASQIEAKVALYTDISLEIANLTQNGQKEISAGEKTSLIAKYSNDVRAINAVEGSIGKVIDGQIESMRMLSAYRQLLDGIQVDGEIYTIAGLAKARAEDKGGYGINKDNLVSSKEIESSRAIDEQMADSLTADEISRGESYSTVQMNDVLNPIIDATVARETATERGDEGSQMVKMTPEQFEVVVDAIADRIMVQYPGLFTNKTDIKETILTGVSAYEMFALKEADLGTGGYIVDTDSVSGKKVIKITNNGKPVDNLNMPGMWAIEMSEGCEDVSRPSVETFISSKEAIAAFEWSIGFSGTFSEAVKGIIKDLHFAEIGGTKAGALNLGVTSALVRDQADITDVIVSTHRGFNEKGAASVEFILTPNADITESTVRQLTEKGVPSAQIVSLSADRLDVDLAAFAKDAVEHSDAGYRKAIAEVLNGKDITKLPMQEKLSMMMELLKIKVKAGLATYIVLDVDNGGRGLNFSDMKGAFENIKGLNDVAIQDGVRQQQKIQATLWAVNFEKMDGTQYEQALGRLDHRGEKVSRFNDAYYHRDIVQITSVESARENKVIRDAVQGEDYSIDAIINALPDVQLQNETEKLSKAGNADATSTSSTRREERATPMSRQTAQSVLEAQGLNAPTANRAIDGIISTVGDKKADGDTLTGEQTKAIENYANFMSMSKGLVADYDAVKWNDYLQAEAAALKDVVSGNIDKALEVIRSSGFTVTEQFGRLSDGVARIGSEYPTALENYRTIVGNMSDKERELLKKAQNGQSVGFFGNMTLRRTGVVKAGQELDRLVKGFEEPAQNTGLVLDNSTGEISYKQLEIPAQEPGNVVPFVSDRYTPADIIDHYGMPELLKTVSGIIGDDITERNIQSALQNCAVDALMTMGKVTEINALGKLLADVILTQRVESEIEETGMDYMLAAGVEENAQPIMLKDVKKHGNLEYAVAESIEEVKMPEEGVIGVLNKEGAETLHLINIRGVTDGTVSYMEEGTMKYASLDELEALGFTGLIMTDRDTKRANKETLRSLNASKETVAEIMSIDTTSRKYMRSNEYKGARKLANAIVNGVMEGEESSKAVMYVLNIWQNMGAMAERLNISEADIESADGVNLIAQGYLNAVGEVVNAGESGVLSPGEVMTEVKLLSTVRDMLIAVNKDNSGELKTLLNKAELSESDISKIKSRLVVSKAVNMNVMIRGMEEAKSNVSVAGEDYEFDIAKLKSSVEEKKSIKERFKGKFFSSSAKLEDVLPTLGSDTFIANRGTIVSPMMARALAAAA